MTCCLRISRQWSLSKLAFYSFASSSSPGALNEYLRDMFLYSSLKVPITQLPDRERSECSSKLLCMLEFISSQPSIIMSVCTLQFISSRFSSPCSQSMPNLCSIAILTPAFFGISAGAGAKITVFFFESALKLFDQSFSEFTVPRIVDSDSVRLIFNSVTTINLPFSSNQGRALLKLPVLRLFDLLAATAFDFRISICFTSSIVCAFIR